MSDFHNPIHLDPRHFKQASQVMSRAFHNDPVWVYLLPDETKRRRLLPAFFNILVRYSLRYGQVYSTANIEGVACWLPPGNTFPRFDRLARIGTLDGLRASGLGLAGFRRYLHMESYFDNIHKQAVPGPHWYLWGIGVDPACQGQGIGAALMQPILALAANDGLPCYLETSNERNVPFYRKHGFVVSKEGIVPGTELRVWRMVRYAKLGTL
jgi:ribosomal protein S18 acetylase RimI-like enzyme